MKYIVVTGGVVSGLGKGITISSIGRMLKSSGVRVTSIKIDPYMNIDAGTMSPFEHGETFVLDDGGETDLDLGNYERFLDVTLSGQHNITTGKIYHEVLDRERRGDYLGKTVQIVPHATDMIISWIKDVSQRPVDGSGATPDVCLIEVGGTVGDIESMVFLEALRQLQFIMSPENLLFVHVSLVPVLGVVGEQKTKPTQHSVKELRSAGISPDVIVCRSTTLLDNSTKHKLSAFCQVPATNVLSVHDVSNIYHVPLILAEQGLHHIIRDHLNLQGVMAEAPDFTVWRSLATTVDTIDHANTTHKEVVIALVGKYTGLSDSYLSVIKALKHSAIHLKLKLNIVWVDASELEEEMKIIRDETADGGGVIGAPSAEGLAKYEAAWKIIEESDGILVPGGFGVRGVEGKIAAARYARTHQKPYLGICLGMQVMVIEYARHVLEMRGANSMEFDESTANPVVIFMPEINQKVMGGTMRLGARPTTIMSYLPTAEDLSESDGKATNASSSEEKKTRTLASEVYMTGGFKTKGQEGEKCERDLDEVSERHRHRYEVNPEFAGRIQSGGLVFSGVDDKLERMEIAELPRCQHPFYFGTQFHPEFKSRPHRPSPPVCAFMAMAAGLKDKLNSAGQLWQAHTEELQASRQTTPVQSPYKQIASKSAASSGAVASGITSPKGATDLRRKRSISALSEL